MAFVNEYALKEDVEKYNLEELCLTVKKKYALTRWFDFERLGFTIDRKQNIFLIYMDNLRDPEYDREKTDESIWVLHDNGKNIEVKLSRSADSKGPTGPVMLVLNEKRKAIEEGKRFDQIVFKEVWDLVFIDPLPTDSENEIAIKKTIKEALKVYGHHGVYNKPLLVKNTVVQCNW